MFVKVASVLIGTLVLLQNANGQSCICKCGPTGLFGQEDLCSAPAPSNGPLVVRPKALVKPTVTLPLFGNHPKGPCFRKQAIVKPAVVPRPVYLQSDCVTNTNCNNYASHQATSGCTTNVIQKCTTNYGCDGIDVSKAYAHACTDSKPAAPADAVSLAIAYKHSQNNYAQKIAEDRLAYGFRKLPIDHIVPKKNVYKNILPEKSLYDMNGQVLELKTSDGYHTSCDDLSEEAQEELLDLAISEEAGNVPCGKRPSLDELGYAPAKIGSTSFVNIPSLPIPSLPSLPLPTPTAVCDDGFKAGTVEYKSVAKIEPIIKFPSLIDDTSCESQEEAVRHIEIPAPTCSCNYNGNTAGLVHSHHRVSKSSSCSTKHQQKSHVTFEKLCH